jgi:hypothetical protein
VCELEGLDVHSLEPPLPCGFFLVVRRKVVRGHPQLDLGWHVPKCATVVEESGIDRVLQSKWSENPAAGAHVPLRWRSETMRSRKRRTWRLTPAD